MGIPINYRWHSYNISIHKKVNFDKSCTTNTFCLIRIQIKYKYWFSPILGQKIVYLYKNRYWQHALGYGNANGVVCQLANNLTSCLRYLANMGRAKMAKKKVKSSSCRRILLPWKSNLSHFRSTLFSFLKMCKKSHRSSMKTHQFTWKSTSLILPRQKFPERQNLLDIEIISKLVQ